MLIKLHTCLLKRKFQSFVLPCESQGWETIPTFFLFLLFSMQQHVPICSNKGNIHDCFLLVVIDLWSFTCSLKLRKKSEEVKHQKLKSSSVFSEIINILSLTGNLSKWLPVTLICLVVPTLLCNSLTLRDTWT